MLQMEIVFVRFPYSDLSASKMRPALIISNNEYNGKSEDVLICAITSNLEAAEYSIFISDKDIEDGKLPIKSKIRADKIMLINKSLVAGKLALLNKKKFSETIKQVAKLTRS